MSVPSPVSRLTIDLDALARNFAAAKTQAGGADVAPAVKADAYGLGAVPVAQRLWAEGARRFFVARLEEGEDLRTGLGPERPATIYVLDGLIGGAAARFAASELTRVLNSLGQVGDYASSVGVRGCGAVLHVDTGHNLPEIIEFRDQIVERHGLRLHVASVEEYINDGRLTERPDGIRNPLQTIPLLDAITENRFDAVFGGGRRDEERSRAKERIFSLRNAFGQWDPKRQRPELWNLYNGRHAPGEHVRVFPLSNWTELDIWRYISREQVLLAPLYYAHEREVYNRDGMWMTSGPWGGPREDETVESRTVRYRTVGDGSTTGAVLSDAADNESVLAEVAASRLTERGATRGDDRVSEAAMEDRKREGYF